MGQRPGEDGGVQGMGCLKGEKLEVLQNTEERGEGFPSRPWRSTGGQIKPPPPGTDLRLCQSGLSQLSYLLGSSPCALPANPHPGPQLWECATLRSVSRDCPSWKT